MSHITVEETICDITDSNEEEKPHHHGWVSLAFGSIGIVYGDIGTSPLYALRESLTAASKGGNLSPAEIIGVLSMILWTLIVIVTIKYVMLVLRADNHGEGGILSLMAMARDALGKHCVKRGVCILFLGMAGAALFYGDATITPAISVLSAVEGLSLVTNKLDPYLVLIALVIIVILFLMQRSGTEKVARYFSPVMVLWFIILAAGGIYHLQDYPEVLNAFNPWLAVTFILHHGMISFMTLGAVFLTVTGAEALYADLGHFGKKPIRYAWLYLVMPSLFLNYLGQAALVLSNPAAAANPFFLLYPEWALLPMVILSGFATVIASQAVISGAFSLTHQAVQLGLLPRLHVEYTSAKHIGQIYMPKVNWLLLCCVLMLIALFRSSSNLASAYGIAVTGTMIITAILIFIVMRHQWKWSLSLSLLVISPLLIIDGVFLAANLMKVLDGGYMPLLFSSILIVMMRTWLKGTSELQVQSQEEHHTMEWMLKELHENPPHRVDGTAVYLTSTVEYAPPALLQNLKHNKVLHQRNIILTLRFDNRPYIKDNDRVSIEVINDDFTRVYMHFGYMEKPNVTRGLQTLHRHGIKLIIMMTSFFISRRKIVQSKTNAMPIWQDKLFMMMANSASDAAAFFHIPPTRVVELGVQMTV